MIGRRPPLNRYGWVPSLPDTRDYLVKPITAKAVAKLPAHVDLRSDPRMPAVWDQGQLGSCTAHGTGAALVFHELVEVMPSRLFLYWNTRALEGTVLSDSGGQIRDAIKVAGSLGVCPELEWPYDIGKFTKRPPCKCYKDKARQVALTYRAVPQDTAQIRGQLAAGNLVVVGFSVYSGFESQAVAETGVADLPAAGETLMGGHCVAVVGYDDPTSRFIVRNSWGSSWAGPMAGYFTLPYSYLANPQLSSDFWTISKTSTA